MVHLPATVSPHIRWSICRCRQTFFGLSDEYGKAAYDTIFYLVYYGGISFIEAYNFPVKMREYFANRLIKEIERKNEAIEKANKSSRGSSFGR